MYSEVTLTAPKGRYIKNVRKYWVVADNEYMLGRMVSDLIHEFRQRFGETPEIEVYRIKNAYGAYEPIMVPA